MRTARKDGKQRAERDQRRQKGRQIAMELLKQNIPIRKTVDRVHENTGIKISKGTVGSIRKALYEKDEERLHKLIIILPCFGRGEEAF